MDSRGSPLAAGLDELGGSHNLARVPLRVVGKMNKQASYCGRKLFFSHAPRLLQIGSGKSSDALGGTVESLVKFSKDLLPRDGRIKFGLIRDELFRAELIALGIGEQAVEAAHDVAHMKGDGREPRRRGVKR